MPQFKLTVTAVSVSPEGQDISQENADGFAADIAEDLEFFLPGFEISTAVEQVEA